MTKTREILRVRKALVRDNEQVRRPLAAAAAVSQNVARLHFFELELEIFARLFPI
jgi:hypothetical protein